MSKQYKENHGYGAKNAYGKGNRNQGNHNPYPGKNAAIPRTKRESYRKTVYPSHEKRNHRNG